MARLALPYMSNFPSSTNQHAMNHPARSSLPTSAHSHSFSAHRGASTRCSCVSCFSCDYASELPTFCEGEKNLGRSHWHLQSAIGHVISENIEERNRENDLVPTRRRSNDHEKTWGRHRRWCCINAHPQPPPSQNNPIHLLVLAD